MSPDNCVIRNAAKREIPEIEALIVAAYCQYRHAMPKAVFDGYLDDLSDLAKNLHDAEALVAELDGRIAGSALFYPDAGDEGWGLPKGWAGFRKLAVHPAKRGCGLGRKLAEKCVEMGKAVGAPAVAVHTAPFMRAARNIYERIGFRRCPDYDIYASEVLGLGHGSGDVKLMSYRLNLAPPSQGGGEDPEVDLASDIDSDEGLDATLQRELIEIAQTNGIEDSEAISAFLGAERAPGVKTARVGRPLGPLEHLFWLFDQHRPVHFAVTGEVAGTARHAAWRGALDRVQARHPLLGCYTEGRGGVVPVFRPADGAPIPLRIVAGDPQADWRGVVGEELAVPFDSGTPPLVRAVLVEDGRNSALTLVAHHSVGDGLSLAYAIRDTLCALSGKGLDPLPALPSQEAMLGIGAQLEAAAAPSPERGEAVFARPVRYRPSDGAQPTVSALQLTPSLTSKLRGQARRAGTTVHGALSAAVAIAGRQVFTAWREAPVRILSPINTRPLLGVGDNCGLFVGAGVNGLDARATNFWDLACNAKADLATFQSRDGIVAGLSAIAGLVGDGIDVAGAADFVANAFAREVLLTNLGVLPFDERSPGLRLDRIWGPAVLAGIEAEQTIGVATLDGSICLTHASHSPSEGLLEAIRDVLAEACQ